MHTYHRYMLNFSSSNCSISFFWFWHFSFWNSNANLISFFFVLKMHTFLYQKEVSENLNDLSFFPLIKLSMALSYEQIHDFLKFNTPTRLNWILTEQTHSPIRLSLCLLETGVLFFWPSSKLHITSVFQDPHPPIPSIPTQFLNLFLFSQYKEVRTVEIVSFWCNFFLYQYHYIKKKKKK